jgi:tetratricopeptide (TPR) repeat protein
MENTKMNEIVEQAKQDFQQGNYKAAIDGFKIALETYRAEGKELESAEMANNLSVALLKNKKHKQALEIVLGTDAIFERHNETTKQAMALGNQAAAYEAQKQYDKAEQAYQKSAELLKTTGDEDLRGYVLQSLSALQLRQGKNLDGLLSMKTGLDGQEKLPLRKRILRWFLKLPFRFLGGR